VRDLLQNCIRRYIYAKNDMLKKVHQMMGHVKSNEEVSIEYMKIFEREKRIREEVKCVN
jgi:hypothetical protein